MQSNSSNFYLCCCQWWVVFVQWLHSSSSCTNSRQGFYLCKIKSKSYHSPPWWLVPCCWRADPKCAQCLPLVSITRKSRSLANTSGVEWSLEQACSKCAGDNGCCWALDQVLLVLEVPWLPAVCLAIPCLAPSCLPEGLQNVIGLWCNGIPSCCSRFTQIGMVGTSMHAQASKNLRRST